MILPLFNPRLTFIGLLLLWVVIQATMLLRLGIQTPVDSELYLSEANNLLAGHWPQGRGIWYISYSSFLAFIFFLGGSNSTIILLQIVLSGVAAWSLYEMALEVCGSRQVSFLTVIFYLAWIKIHEWNTILYTESLFTSCSIICFAILVKSKKPWHYIIVFLLTLFTFLIRPTGFAFLIGLLFYFIFSIKNKIDRKLFIAIMVIAAFGTVLLASYMLGGANLIDSYIKAEVIFPNISLGLNIPTDLVIPDAGLPAMVRLVKFAFYNPIYFTELSFYKLLLFIGNVKPYFSMTHNAMIVLVLYPIYIFAIIGYHRFSKTQNEKYFIGGYIACQAFIVSLTSENWDGRFLIPVLPFIFFLAAEGIISTFKPSEKAQF